MKVTIIPSDSVVIVNGRVAQFDFTCDPNYHAVQFENGKGFIETHKGLNIDLDNLDEFQEILTRHAEIVAEQDAAEVERQRVFNLPENVTKREIAALERAITPRRLREAVLSQEGADWLRAVEDEILSKRLQLP